MLTEKEASSPGKNTENEGDSDEDNTDEVNEAASTVPDKSYTLIIGRNDYDYPGANIDIPRDLIVGLSISHFYCNGYCEWFYEFTGATGSRTKEVSLKVIGARARGGFLYNPLITKWVIFGLGPDISLRYDKVTNQYQDITSRDDVFSAELGLAAKLRVFLGGGDNGQTGRSKTYIILSYRAFVQTVLRSCKDTSNTDAPFEGCRNSEALQTYEKYEVHGGGYEVYLGLEFRF